MPRWSPVWSYNGHSYLLTNASETWTQAEAEAEALGGHLATVNDAAEQTWLTSTFGNFANLWIGCTDQAVEGTWQWADGSAMDYNNWASGEPRPDSYWGTPTDWAYMDSGGQWHAYPHSWTNYRGLSSNCPGAGSGGTGPGPSAQYLLNVDTADLVPPQVTGVTRAAGGGDHHRRAGAVLHGDPERGLEPGHGQRRQPHGVELQRPFLHPDPELRDLGGGGDRGPDPGGPPGAGERRRRAGLAAPRPSGSYGNTWIGLNDQATEGSWRWAGDGASAYTNWASGQPSSGTNYNYAYEDGSGKWATPYAPSNYTYQGVIELTGADTDKDGLPDVLDPYVSDPHNAWDLRAAGTDGVFDTADDVIYRLTEPTAYSGGTSVSLFINNGPLPSGHYRFTANSTLTDVVGNALDGNGNGVGGDAYQQVFDVAIPAGVTLENGNNDTLATATPLPLTEDPAGSGLFLGRGSGRQDPATNGTYWSDPDYWSFEAQAGDIVSISVTPAAAAASTPTWSCTTPPTPA